MNDKKAPIPIKFNAGCVVHAPAECLIEDYQTLQQAIRERDWDAVGTVVDCLSSVIDDYLEVPAELGLKFKPSATSAILMDWESGILSKPDGSDVCCANGMGISEVLTGANCGCYGSCPYLQEKRCGPESGLIRLENDGLYFAGELNNEENFESSNGDYNWHGSQDDEADAEI